MFIYWPTNYTSEQTVISYFGGRFSSTDVSVFATVSCETSGTPINIRFRPSISPSLNGGLSNTFIFVSAIDSSDITLPINLSFPFSI